MVALAAGLGGGALVGASLGRADSVQAEKNLRFAALMLGLGLGFSAGLFFARAEQYSGVWLKLAFLLAGSLVGLAAGLPGRSLGLRFRPSVVFFDQLWPYLKEMAIPLAAFSVGYFCLTLVFAGLYGTVWRLDKEAFSGLPSSPQFWDFVYFSLMTASTANTGVSAVSRAAQGLTAVEVILGMGWLIVVFGALSAHLAPRLEAIAAALHTARDSGPSGPTSAALPRPAAEMAHQLALHEAGHAVAAVALGFELRTLSLTVGEGYLLGLPEVPWLPEGDADTSACTVLPTNGTPDRCRQAAIVAVAGREARRRLYPDVDAAWSRYEAIDRNMALEHIGFVFPDPVRVILDPNEKRRANEAADQALAPVVEAAKRLLAEGVNWKATMDLQAHLIGQGSIQSRCVHNGQEGLVFESQVKGKDALRVILGGGLMPHPSAD
jgi:hypothetical protein